jgi:hypothetical protein
MRAHIFHSTRVAPKTRTQPKTSLSRSCIYTPTHRQTKTDRQADTHTPTPTDTRACSRQSLGRVSGNDARPGGGPYVSYMSVCLCVCLP